MSGRQRVYGRLDFAMVLEKLWLADDCRRAIIVSIRFGMTTFNGDPESFGNSSFGN